jgi:hypothetical protein
MSALFKNLSRGGEVVDEGCSVGMRDACFDFENGTHAVGKAASCPPSAATRPRWTTSSVDARGCIERLDPSIEKQ